MIAAGERWDDPTGTLRPAAEDFLGAGAIIQALGRRSVSPEARLAAGALGDLEPNEMFWSIRESASGREKRSHNLARDVELAAALNTSALVPTLDGQRIVDGR